MAAAVVEVLVTAGLKTDGVSGQNPGPALSTSGSPPWVQILSEDPDQVLTSVQSRTEKLQRLDLLNDAFRVCQKNVP